MSKDLTTGERELCELLAARATEDAGAWENSPAERARIEALGSDTSRLVADVVDSLRSLAQHLRVKAGRIA